MPVLTFDDARPPSLRPSALPSYLPGPNTTPMTTPSWSPKIPSISHLGVFVSGAGVGPAGAGPEGVSSGVWAGVRSSMSSDSMGSRGGTSLSTGSDGCELKAVSEATVGVCGGG